MVTEKKIVLFPGQGAQFPGMGKDFYEEDSRIRELFELASDSSQLNLKKILFHGNDEDLQKTDNLQAAMTLVNLSVSMYLRERGMVFDGCAGFSLGEYAALAEAGIIRMEDIFRVAAFRGKCMQKACDELEKSGRKTGMAAVVGLSAEKITELLDNEKIEEVYPANHNSPVQLVISGVEEGLARAEEILKNGGAKRFIRLKVAGPFHSPLMNGAAEEFSQWLSDIVFSVPEKDFYSNVTADKVTNPEEIKTLCRKQIISSVRWVDEQNSFSRDGYRNPVECGPGKVLTGLWKSSGNEGICSFTQTREQADLLLKAGE